MCMQFHWKICTFSFGDDFGWIHSRSLGKHVPMLDQKLAYVVKSTDENDGSVENHQRVEIAVNLSEFPVRLCGLRRPEESDVPDDGETCRTGGQSLGPSCQGPNQTKQHNNNGHRHPHTAVDRVTFVTECSCIYALSRRPEILRRSLY